MGRAAVPSLSRFTGVIIGLAAVIVLSVAVVVSAALAGGPQLTKEPIPPEAVENGAFNKALIPDFIPALDRHGQVAGYVARDLAIPDGAPLNGPMPVFADDLKTLVGHMYPGRGFVALGESPDLVPVIPATLGGEGADAP